MAKALFQQGAPIHRHQNELALRSRIVEYWAHLAQLQRNGKLTDQELGCRLEELDTWANGRLSGTHLLFLAKHAEKDYPQWIALMPRLLALRYEELRVARLWSSLLNPRALSRLRQAIHAERNFDQ